MSNEQLTRTYDIFWITGVLIFVTRLTWLVWRELKERKRRYDEEQLLVAASYGDVYAMQQLAAMKNPKYMSAFRNACIEVLGEDPEEDWA